MGACVGSVWGGSTASFIGRVTGALVLASPVGSISSSEGLGLSMAILYQNMAYIRKRGGRIGHRCEVKWCSLSYWRA